VILFQSLPRVPLQPCHLQGSDDAQVVPACHTSSCTRGAVGQGCPGLGGTQVAPADRLLLGRRSGGPEEDDLHGEAGREQRGSVQEGGQKALLVRGAALARVRWGRCHGKPGVCRDARLRLQYAPRSACQAGCLFFQGIHKLVVYMLVSQAHFAFHRWYSAPLAGLKT